MVGTYRPLEEKMTLFWANHFATGYSKVENAYLMYKQNALLRDDEMPAKLPGAHAEMTVLWKAVARGYTPRALATSWPICSDCWPMIKAFGGKKISPTLAIFPTR